MTLAVPMIFAPASRATDPPLRLAESAFVTTTDPLDTITLAVLLTNISCSLAAVTTAVSVPSVIFTGHALAIPVGVDWITEAVPMILAPAKSATDPPLILLERALVTTIDPLETMTLATLLILAVTVFVTTAEAVTNNGEPALTPNCNPLASRRLICRAR